jgi:hypothetical protein
MPKSIARVVPFRTALGRHGRHLRRQSRAHHRRRHRDRTATATALARVRIDRRRLRPHRAHAAEAAQMLGELSADRSAPVADVTAPRTSYFPSKGPAQSGDGSWKFDDLIFRAAAM